MRNPDRDLGAQHGINRIALNAEGVTLFGKPGNQPEKAVWQGSYDAEEKILSIYIPNRGGHFDFERDGDESEFYQRGKRPEEYSYSPPSALDDKWPTATVDDVDIDRKGIEYLVQTLLAAPIEERNPPKIHSILVGAPRQTCPRRVFPRSEP